MSNKGITIRMNAAENSVDVYGNKFKRTDNNRRLVSETGEVSNYKQVVNHVCFNRGIK